jgi:hypothetical protein
MTGDFTDCEMRAINRCRLYLQGGCFSPYPHVQRCLKVDPSEQLFRMMFILIEYFGLQNYGLERLLGAFLKLGLKGFNQQYLLQVQSTHTSDLPTDLGTDLRPKIKTNRAFLIFCAKI